MMESNQRKALHYHAKAGSYLEVQHLLNQGVDPNRKDSRGTTPLISAAEESHRDIVELLINSGADIHLCNRVGHTVLHLASMNGWVEIVHCLVNKGVAVDLKTYNGTTPLMFAAQWSNVKVFELLLNFGANIYYCDKHCGDTVLHHAIGAEKESIEMVQCLVNKGVVLDKKNHLGVTPLMFAAQSSNVKVLELLINFGAGIHLCDKRGWTLLHHASFVGSGDIIQCLVNKGVSLDIKNRKGQTPLCLAINLNKMKFARYLLKVGADCNLENNKGESPFGYLIRQNRPNVKTIKLCIEKGTCVKLTDYNVLLKNPLLRTAILQDAELCSQVVINKFNNRDLPLLYKRLASAQILPHIDQMKIGSGSKMALEVKRAATHEIQAKDFCNVFELVPLVLKMLCVKSLK